MMKHMDLVGIWGFTLDIFGSYTKNVGKDEDFLKEDMIEL